jgi:hypothetical protein
MIKIENDCVCCDIPCIDCGRKRTPHYYCDKCKEETTIYEYEDGQYCIDCIKEKLTVVEGSEW